ncbi:T9SS type A sorting domain-containing protein [Flavobacterium lotistagni]|uniref:T9SS type A sorting domain-containing protein n=1 Tax=Flavobacterium lotistagni TaxID=2709660 RepID=UPI001F2605C3|nr:T9SS type A sorting domain-containing protein [Flavobacterium lotistagni]
MENGNHRILIQINRILILIDGCVLHKDMLGKQIEKISAEANALRHLSIGQSYPSGFYNLKVSQGDKSQTVRMVKQ